METLGVYLPIDRWQALNAGRALPDRAWGAALFADVSGFTRLTEALVNDLGPQRGAEELTRSLNLVYDALVAELHRFGGSVISFSGDAITCWFDGDPGVRAVTCAVAMQAAMHAFAAMPTPSGRTVSLALKVAVAAGPVRRFVVGDPGLQLIDALAGGLLDELAAAEHHAQRGDIVVTRSVVDALGSRAVVNEWREEEETGQRFAVLVSLAGGAAPLPWAQLLPDDLPDEIARQWLLPAVYRRLKEGRGEFLAELRPAVALFLRFGGLDYDADAEAGDKLNAYIRRVQRVLADYDGNLLGLTIGDKGSYLYAAFGAPVAHEDDARRAVSAALQLQAVPVVFAEQGVQIGLSQGRVRTGAYGGALRRTYGVLGNDVNLAARLMQTAAPGQTLASAATRQAAGEAFAWEGLGAVTVKGREAPVPVFRLLGVRARETARLQGMRYALPMVGRETEFDLIRQKMDLALRGHGQIVGVSAEAGMGKTRLVAEVIAAATARRVAGYGGECQSYGTNTAYLVWHNIWRGFFSVDPAATPDELLLALEVQLRLIHPDLAPRAPLLGAVLNLPLPDNDFTRTFDAKLRKTSLEALLVDCLRARAREAPLYLVLEDCHWLDPVSHDLLEVVGRAIAGLPVLVVMAYRPPDLARLQAQRVSVPPHFTEIALAEFSPAEAERLIRLKLTQGFGDRREVPAVLVDRIRERAQGNPFYIEELLNYLHDRGLDPADQQALEQLDLPASLHSLILSRIDQLTESQKITLKVASVIGRLFRPAMLWGVYPQLGAHEQVLADLNVLQSLDLTPVDTPEPEVSYLFKHVVTQEVAYESLPYAQRAFLHDQIGQFIERTSPDTLDQLVNLLAFHYDRTENQPKRREYLLRAGQAAQAAYANAAAIDYFQRVLPLLPSGERAAVMRRLGQVLELVGKWREAGAYYRQALELSGQLEDGLGQAQAQALMGELLRKQGQYDEARRWLEQAQAGFEAAGDRSGVAQVFHYLGSLASQQGDHAAARQLYEASLAIRRALDERPGIASLLSNLGIVARSQGDYARARQLHEEGLAIRRTLGNKWAIGVSLNNLANVAIDQGDFHAARERLEEALRLMREVGDRYVIATFLDNLGNAARALCDYPAARRLYVESLEMAREFGDRWLLAYVLEDVGVLAAAEGQAERAWRMVGAAATLREAIGAPLSAAEREKLEGGLASAREAAPADVRNAWTEQGRQLSLEATVAEALGGLQA